MSEGLPTTHYEVLGLDCGHFMAPVAYPADRLDEALADAARRRLMCRKVTTEVIYRPVEQADSTS